jgi:hypothetical protein
MTSDAYTPSSLQSYIYMLNFDASISTVFGLFCIFVILRYSASTIENRFRFHLLNITAWILICDLTISILARPYPIFPVNGGCLIGEFTDWLKGWMKAKAVLQFEFVSDFKAGLSGQLRKHISQCPSVSMYVSQSALYRRSCIINPPPNFDALNLNLKSVFQNSIHGGPGRPPKFVDFYYFLDKRTPTGS